MRRFHFIASLFAGLAGVAARKPKMTLPYWDGDPRKCTIIAVGTCESVNGQWFIDNWHLDGRCTVATRAYVPGKYYRFDGFEFGGYTPEELRAISRKFHENLGCWGINGSPTGGPGEFDLQIYRPAAPAKTN